MDKMEKTISNYRVDEKTHEIVHKVARKKIRKVTDLARTSLLLSVQIYVKTGKWPEDIEELVECVRKL